MQIPYKLATSGGNPVAITSLKQLHTRFIYSFFFERGKVYEASQKLQQANIAGKNNAWICPAKQHFRANQSGKQDEDNRSSDRRQSYSDEVLDHVKNFLFPQQNATGCDYLIVSDQLINTFFHKAEINLHHNEVLRFKPVNRVGCEVFLTPQGVGVLSITLTPDREIIELDTAIDFNYQIARVHPTDLSRIHLKHASEDQSSWKSIPEAARAQVKPPPTFEAKLSERLGVGGAYFTLTELVEALLEPLNEGKGKLQKIHSGFSVYTVARFGDEVDFENPEVRDQLAPFLSALAQVEEPEHAGIPADSMGVSNAILNRRHWTAVGQLGAVHIVADQPNIGDKEHSFNQQRIPRVRDKYFVPYLMALFQRLTLNRAIADAAFIMYSDREAMEKRLADLRMNLLEFAVSGHFSQVSKREALHRFYRIAQEGLDVPEAWKEVRQAIVDIDAKQNEKRQADYEKNQLELLNHQAEFTKSQAKLAERQVEVVDGVSENLKAITRVQEIIHLIEFFIISVYSAHLWHMFAAENDHLYEWVKDRVGSHESFISKDWFVSLGVVVFALLGVAIALLVIKFQKKLFGEKR